jgi:hypothetical protein
MTQQQQDALEEAFQRVRDILIAKGKDYGPTDRWASFRATAAYFGGTLWESADFNEVQKLSRLAELRRAGVQPTNESVYDSYLDKAAYGILGLAMLIDETAVPDSKVER